MLQRLVDAVGQVETRGYSITDWSFCGGVSQRFSLGIKDAQAGNPHAPLSLSHAGGVNYVLVWSDGRLSRGFLERRQLEGDVRQTLGELRAAAYDDPDDATIPAPTPYPEVELFDPHIAQRARGEAAATLDLEQRLDAIRSRIDCPEITTWSGSFSWSLNQTHLVNSAGIDASAESTSWGWFVSLNGQIGDGFGARSPESEPDFEQRLDRVVDLARKLEQDTDAVDGGTYPVIFHPRVVEAYTLPTLLHHLSSSTVFHDEGRFPRRGFDDGKQVVRSDIKLSLDPTQPLRSGSYRFSSRGVPAMASVLIDKGRLVQPIVDLKYARRLERKPTAAPAAMDIVELSGGASLTLEQAIAEATGGMVVLSVLGVHTQDRASGDFSLSAPQVLRVTDRGLDGRLRATVSGNLFQTLNDPALQFVRFPGEHTPGLMFPCRLDPK